MNAPLREALARIGGADPLHLAVGPDELAVTTLDGPVVEKKVPLPERWLRGFAEVQVLAAGFDLRAELAAAEGQRFLRSPPGGRQRPGVVGLRCWLAGRCGWPRRPVPGAVCVPGPQRLATLEPPLRHARRPVVYGPVIAGEPAIGQRLGAGAGWHAVAVDLVAGALSRVLWRGGGAGGLGR